MHASHSDHADAAQAGASVSRRQMLGRAALVGVSAVPLVGTLASPSVAAPQQTLDAADNEAFTDIRLHENDHVAYLKSALGNKARPKPTFKGITTSTFATFLTMSRTFENVGVGAYLGALPAISSKAYVAAAGSIALIEARHAGFLNVFSGLDNSLQAKNNAPSAFEKALTIQEVVTRVSPYIVSLNGGPAATFKAGDDVSILNFALLLEYLEAEFYNINVPKYFTI